MYFMGWIASIFPKPIAGCEIESNNTCAAVNPMPAMAGTPLATQINGYVTPAADKDYYSFDVDDAGLERSYQRHRDAYIKTFTRLGLDFVIVSAMSGAMGGSKSEEFLQPTEVGEDTFVRCSACGYAANVEAVTTPVPAAQNWDAVPAAHAELTPDTKKLNDKQKK